MIEVRQADTIEALVEYRRDWNRLLAETPGAVFFQSLDWLELYWRYYTAGQKLRVLIVRDGHEVQGIVPLVVRREKTRVGRLAVLGYPLDNWASFYGPVGPRPAETLHAALGHVRRDERDWDILELRWVGAPETDADATGRAMREAGFQAIRTVWDRTALVDCTAGWEAYWASRDADWRRNLRRAERKLRQAGRARFVRFRPGEPDAPRDDPRWDLYEACQRVAARSWQAQATDGTTLTHAQVRDFLRDVHGAAVAAGAVDLNLLLVDDEPVAFAYNYVLAGRVCGLRAGFDAEQFQHGAGTLLLAEAIRGSFARGDRWYDLGAGSLEAKRYFQTEWRPIFRFSHYHPGTLRAQLLRARRWAQSRRTGG